MLMRWVRKVRLPSKDVERCLLRRGTNEHREYEYDELIAHWRSVFVTARACQYMGFYVVK